MSLSSLEEMSTLLQRELNMVWLHLLGESFARYTVSWKKKSRVQEYPFEQGTRVLILVWEGQDRAL